LKKWTSDKFFLGGCAAPTAPPLATGLNLTTGFLQFYTYKLILQARIQGYNPNMPLLF